MKFNPSQPIEVPRLLQKKTELFLEPTSNFKVPIMDDINNKRPLHNPEEINGQKNSINDTKTNTQNASSVGVLQKRTIRNLLPARTIAKTTSNYVKHLVSENNFVQQTPKTTEALTNKANQVEEVVIISTDSSHDSSNEKQEPNGENMKKRKKRSNSVGKTNGADKKLKASSSQNSLSHLNVINDIRIKNEKVIESFFENCSKYVDEKLESLNNFFNTNIINSKKTKSKSSSFHNVKSNLEKFSTLKLQTKIHKLHNNHLNKLNRLNDLIDLNSINFQKANQISKAKKNNHMSHYSPQTSKQNKITPFSNRDKPNKSLTNTKNLIEIENNDQTNESNSLQKENVSNTSQIDGVDSTNEEIDIPGVKKSNASSIVNAHNLPLIPLLTIESEQREKGPAVILTWKIQHLVTKKILEDNEHENYDILEYQLYGYREQSGQVNSNWNFIGPVKPYKPPIKCTLTDFLIGSFYNFSVRIKDKSGRLSQFSSPAKIKL